jgi:hypothetical protein
MIKYLAAIIFSFPIYGQDIANVSTPSIIVGVRQDILYLWASPQNVDSSSTAAVISSFYMERKDDLMQARAKWLHQGNIFYVAGDVAAIQSMASSTNQRYKEDSFSEDILFTYIPTMQEMSRRLPVIKQDNIKGKVVKDAVEWFDQYGADIYIMSVDGEKLKYPLNIMWRKTNTLTVRIDVLGGIVSNYSVVNK